jgi:hypothetical protein
MNNVGSFTAGKGSTFIYVKGKVSWVKAVTPNEWNKWSCRLHPDAESLEIIRDLQAEGIKNVIKKDDDGYYTTFSRPCEVELRKGVKVGVTPPEVVDGNGAPMEHVAIGNGSDGTLKLEIYSHSTPGGGRAKAARWAALRIDNLIPFNRDTDYPDEARKELSEGLREQPAPLF